MRTLDSRVEKLCAVALNAAEPATKQESLPHIYMHAKVSGICFHNSSYDFESAWCAEQAHAEMRTLDSRVAKLQAVALNAAEPAT